MIEETFPHAQLRYHPQERILEIIWCDFVSGEQFRETVTRALDLAMTHQARYWLANDTSLRPVRAADRQWMMDSVLPRMAGVGFHRLAGIRSTDPMAQMAVEEFAANLAISVAPKPVRLFDDRPAAWNWLVEGEKASIGGPA
jgi:hypothetical protein